jgi:hypothetical protein
MRLRLGLTAAPFAAMLFTSVALAAAKPPPNNYFYKVVAVRAISDQCQHDNGAACYVPSGSLKNKGTRGSRHYYCDSGTPGNASARQYYKVSVRVYPAPAHAWRVKRC